LAALGFLLAACGGMTTERQGSDSGGEGPPLATADSTPGIPRSIAVVGEVPTPAPSVDGDVLLIGERREIGLAEPAIAPLAGGLAPVATPAPDGRLVAYNTWRELRAIDKEKSLGEQGIETGDPVGIPVIRVLDIESGTDRALEEGSQTPAFRADGALAYALGVEPPFRVNLRYLSRIVVRETLDSAPVVWTDEPANYFVYGWAGKRLVAYRMSEGEHLETLVLDGPGELRVLADGAGVIALSPDGQRALLADQAVPGRVRLVDLEGGKELSSLDLSGVVGTDGAPLPWASASGDWSGSRAVATGGPGLLVIEVKGNELALEATLALDAERYPGSLAEPRFLDASGASVFAPSFKATDGGDVLGVGLVCELATATCRETAAGDPKRWQRLVYSTSRG
jgi:hypothetical protein